MKDYEILPEEGKVWGALGRVDGIPVLWEGDSKLPLGTATVYPVGDSLYADVEWTEPEWEALEIRFGVHGQILESILEGDVRRVVKVKIDRLTASAIAPMREGS